MKKLIIAIGIIAAILAVLISFKAKSQLQVIGRALNFRTEISIKFDKRIISTGGNEAVLRK